MCLGSARDTSPKERHPLFIFWKIYCLEELEKSMQALVHCLRYFRLPHLPLRKVQNPLSSGVCIEHLAELEISLPFVFIR